MNIQDHIDIDYEILDDLPLSDHIEWNHYQSSETNLDELNFEQESLDEYLGKESLDFEYD